MKTNISFIILHYNSFSETVKCVESVLKLKESKIVIVCNGSLNDSDSIVNEKLCKIPNVYIISSKTNLGYSGGMNFGIKYAREKLGSSVLVCLNNDTTIIGNDFLEILDKKCSENSIGVLGPDIINLNGIHQNPHYISVPTKEKIRKQIGSVKRGIRRCKILGGLPEYFICALRRLHHKKKSTLSTETPLLRLHGACVILGPEYLKYYDGFFPGIFLFGEEEILSYLCYKKNIPMVYFPSISIIHHEGRSTKSQLPKIISRHLFYDNNYLASLEVFEKLVEK
jgi:GT2 family glycosyltransferase